MYAYVSRRYEDIFKKNVDSYASEDELAWNPLAIYSTVKHLTVDFEHIKNKMTENTYEGNTQNVE